MTGDSVAKTILILFGIWLLLVVGVAAGIVLGAWALMHYAAGALQGWAS